MTNTQNIDTHTPADPVVENVLIRRYPHGDSRTVCGREIILVDMKTAATALSQSAFMRDWIQNRIQEHIRMGGKFECMDQVTDTPRAVYTLATEQDVAELAVSGDLSEAVAAGDPIGKKSGTKQKRGGSGGRTYHIIVAKLSSIKGKPRAILDQLIANGKTYFQIGDVEAIPGVNLRSFQSAMSTKLKSTGAVVRIDSDSKK